MTSAYITVHLGHVERVHGLKVAYVDPYCLFLVFHVGLFVFNLKHMYNLLFPFASYSSDFIIHSFTSRGCLLTLLARSREALAALTLRSSTPMSQALDLLFSHASLYLIWRDTFERSSYNLKSETCIFKLQNQHVYVYVRKCVYLHHCTRQR